MATLTPAEVTTIQTEIEPIASKRARLLLAMKRLLETIKSSRGYNTDVTEVSFDIRGWQAKSTPETPIIYIIDDTTDIKRHAGSIREHKWIIRLFGVVREMDFIAFEKFISDVEEALKDNNTLFGQCNMMEVIEISTDNQFFSELTGNHLYEIVVEVLFTRKFGEPK